MVGSRRTFRRRFLACLVQFPIVGTPPHRVAQDLIGGIQALRLGARLRIARVQVRVKTPREEAIGVPDVTGTATTGQAEDRVKVSGRRWSCHGPISRASSGRQFLGSERNWPERRCALDHAAARFPPEPARNKSSSRNSGACDWLRLRHLSCVLGGTAASSSLRVWGGGTFFLRTSTRPTRKRPTECVIHSNHGGVCVLRCRVASFSSARATSDFRALPTASRRRCRRRLSSAASSCALR